MFYRVLKDLAITFILAMAVNAIIFVQTGSVANALYFGAGSLASLLIWFMIATWRVAQWIQAEGGENEREGDNHADHDAES